MTQASAQAPIIQAPFTGVITALVTPFKGGVVDYKAYEALIEHQINAGVHGLVPVGTTGETSTLHLDEHKKLVEVCVKAASKRVKVIAGAGSNNTAEALDLAKHAKSVGADAVLVVAPYYNRPSQEGLYRHYLALNDHADIPIVLYNVPSRTMVDLSNDTIERLSRLENIAGIKDATGQIDRLSQMRIRIKEGFSFLSGDDPTFLGYMAHGGHGVISVTSNVAPALMVSLYKACAAGDYTTARLVQDKLITLHKVLFADASPSPTKYALSQMGLTTTEVRLPIIACRQDVRPLVDAAMQIAGL